MRAVILAAILPCAILLPGQEAPKPKPADDQPAGPRPSFEVADVHIVQPRQRNTPFGFGRYSGIHGDRYDVEDASMLDLIRTAYNFPIEKVYGGPVWLEMTRYSIAARVPPHAKAADARFMLQSLLEQRFGLKTHKEDRPVSTFVLAAGKSPKLKEGDSSGDGGCKAQSAFSGNPGPGSLTLFNGDGTTITVGPDGMVTYACRNVSMASLANLLHFMPGANLGINPLLDETGLKGVWNFDLSFNTGLVGSPGSRISIQEAVEKQLGLKLEKREVPTPALVVDSVNESPTPNAEGIAAALPPVKFPTEFEVVSVKMAEPVAPGVRPAQMRMNIAAGGRFNYENLSLSFLIARAFNASSRDQVQGAPPANSPERYSIIGRVDIPPAINPNDSELTAGLLRSLMVKRFSLKYHKEQRPVTVYQLAAGKPKVKKADPANRAHCGRSPGPAGSAPGTQELTCQNVTLQQFADQLEGMSPDLTSPVEDVTGIPGRFDIALSFNFNATYSTGSLPRAAAAGAVVPDASEPNGGYTLAEAIEKELGLKLEKIKRTEEVYVIDHIDTKPTDN